MPKYTHLHENQPDSWPKLILKPNLWKIALMLWAENREQMQDCSLNTYAPWWLIFGSLHDFWWSVTLSCQNLIIPKMCTYKSLLKYICWKYWTWIPKMLMMTKWWRWKMAMKWWGWKYDAGMMMKEWWRWFKYSRLDRARTKEFAVSKESRWWWQWWPTVFVQQYLDP